LLGGTIDPKAPRPSWEKCSPEEPEVFLQQTKAYGLEVVSQQIGKSCFLVCRKILRLLEQAPSRMSENGCQPLCLQIPRFLGPNFINGFAHLHSDVKSVQNMNGLTGFLTMNLRTGSPHVAADIKQFRRTFSPKFVEKFQRRPKLSTFSHLQQTFPFIIDLINDSKELVPTLPQNLIDPDRAHIAQVALCQPPSHSPLHGTEYFLQGCLKGQRSFLP
jgi:hypothetical protein